MKVDLAIELSQADFEWCYMRATRLRRPFDEILSDMIGIGIEVQDANDNAADAESTRNAMTLNGDVFSGSVMPSSPTL